MLCVAQLVTEMVHGAGDVQREEEPHGELDKRDDQPRAARRRAQPAVGKLSGGVGKRSWLAVISASGCGVLGARAHIRHGS
jgi:hypothetical protein